MTTTDWIVVGAALVGGVVVGLVLSRIVQAVLGSEKRPEPLQQAAGPLASLAFWGGAVGGLLVALGVIQPESVDKLITDAVAFVPKAMTAAIIVIMANVLSSFVTAALSTALSRASSSVQTQAVTITRTVILVLAVLLAVPILGVDTTVVNLGVAAVFFALAGSFTLLVGLGGREVAGEVASTRAARRLVKPGDMVDLGQGPNPLAGEVIAIHPTAVEVKTTEGKVVLVPSSRLVNETISIDRAPDQDEG